MKIQVGIAGLGIIGSAVHELFPDAICNDPAKDWVGDLSEANVIFICVPTNLKDGQLDMSIVEDVVSKHKPWLFIICSALQPGTADRLFLKYAKPIVVQPEYFGESIAHPLTDLSKQQFLILGGSKDPVELAINVYQTVYNARVKIRRTTCLEAEVIKLTENRAILFKIAQCQELYDVCEAQGVDYNTIREAVYGDDPRFNLEWTFVYPESRGANSKCIPKDVYGWAAWAPLGKGELTHQLLAYNKGLINR